MKEETFHDKLRRKMDVYVHEIYRVTKKFPREEMYDSASQLRRAALSVVLNYVEGYARNREKVHKNFIEISYGSLRETEYPVQFSFKGKYITEDDQKKLLLLATEIGAMLWGMIRNMKHESRATKQ